MNNPTMDVALLGGSFNPPHIGHAMAALYLKAVVGCDEVWLVPTYNHPSGKQLAPFEDRLSMCLTMGKDLGAWFQVSRAEETLGGEGRTVDLLEYLIHCHKAVKFRWVIGSDILADLPGWKAWTRIQQLVSVTVLHRAGYPSSQAIGPPLALVSSSEIRQQLESGQAASSALIPLAVLHYARAKGLYSPASQGNRHKK